MAKTAKEIVKMKKQGKASRTNFETTWQTLHDYFDNAGTDINTIHFPGTELTVTQLYDTYSLETASILAAGLDNYLTPATSRWYGLRTKDPLKMEKKNVLHYLKDVEAEITHTLNNSNFHDVKTMFYKKSAVYGTSILFEEADSQDYVRFYSVPIKNVVIVEDDRQRVVEYYIDFEYTSLQAVTRFGADKVHPDVLKHAQDNRDTEKKFMYTLHISPNWERNTFSMLSSDKPWLSQWIDDAHEVVIDTGGFDELPALTHRFYRRSETVWGYAPTMIGLVNARLLNAKAKTRMRAEMKQADPPQAMPHNAFLAPYNGNPRGTNYYQRGKLKADDIFSFGNDGNVAVADASIEYQKERLRAQMFTDVFLAFDGITKQMNNPEVFERISEKMTLLGSPVGRFINVWGDVIHRTMGILDRAGRLPDMPDELRDDPSYEIDYMSVLAKAQRNPELNALQNSLQMIAGVASFSPDVMDKIDADKTVDAIVGITGGPVQMLRDDEEVADIRSRRAEKQAQEQQAAMMLDGADMALKATQAGVNVKTAQTMQ